MNQRNVLIVGRLVVVWVCAGAAFRPSAAEPLERLKLIVLVADEEDAEYFNGVLRETDIVMVYGPKRRYLETATRPATMMSRHSLQELRKALARLKRTRVTYLNYNPEQWQTAHVPREELENLPRSVRQARQLAEQHGAKLSFAPDHVLLEKFGAEVAPLVDLFGIQLQRFQLDSPETLQAEARRLVSIVRRGSRQVPIGLQLSFAPPKYTVRVIRGGRKRAAVRDAQGRKVTVPLTAEQVFRQIQLVHDLADYLALIYPPDRKAEVRRLVHRLRPSPSS